MRTCRSVGRNAACRPDSARAGVLSRHSRLMFCAPGGGNTLLAPIGPTRFRTAFRTTIIGFAASSLLPARAGEVSGRTCWRAGKAFAPPPPSRPSSSSGCWIWSRCCCSSALRAVRRRRGRQPTRRTRAREGRRRSGRRGRRSSVAAVFFALAGHPGTARRDDATHRARAARRRWPAPSRASSRPSQRGWP